MTTRDQLEIIGPGGAIRFHDLNPGKGFTNIGSHPDNDIVIDSVEVSPFHAVLDHRQKPCQIILLGRATRTLVEGQPLAPNSARPLANWDTIQLNGHTLVLMEGVAGGATMPMVGSAYASPTPAPAPTPPLPSAIPTPMPVTVAPLPVPALPSAAGFSALPTVAAPLLAAPIPDQLDELILTEISARDFLLEVDQSASFEVTIINGSPLVATFILSLEGLDSDWVVMPGSVNLLDGERATVTVTLTPPRRPSTRAGTHYFGVTVTSPEQPDHRSRLGCTLSINPYFEYGLTDLSPRQQGLSWFRRAGQITYEVANTGNSDAAYRLDASDDERSLQFEFKLDPHSASLAKQAELQLRPEERRSVAVTFNLLKRQFFAWGNHHHSFTVSTMPLQGQLTARTLLGQAQSSALIGPIHIFLLVAALLILIALIFRPSISDFNTDTPEIISGETPTLTWQVSPFADVKIDQEVGEQGRGNGSVTVAPLEDTTYRLTASTPLLSLLLPGWFSVTRELTLAVDPIFPIVRFKVDNDQNQIIAGESATLSWKVLNADEVIFSANGALETIPKEQYTASRVVSPQGQASFSIQARNRYTTAEPVSKTILINAIAPTETPIPIPVINRFDALPSPIIAGEEVTLEWNTSGAEKVRIDPLGQEFPPIGKVVLKPEQSTSYILTALNGPAERKSLREVVVNPAPTPTPVPGAPIVDFFTGTPLEVAVGSDEASNIQLAWSVSGDVTDIELSGETLGRIAGLGRQGTRTVTIEDADAQFVLTARNGDLTASQTLQIKVFVPVPVISSLNPASTTNVGGSGFTLTVSGANFVNGATARWNGSDRPTTFISATQLLASISATDIEQAGTAQVTVFNPANAGGGVSSPATFAINNPVPVLSSISPETALVGAADVTLVVSGSAFIVDSAVRWNGVELQTTFNTPTTLTAVIPADKFASAATATVTVFNPKPSGGSSGVKVFTVANPLPVLTSLGPPDFVTVGDGTTTLIVNGTGFVRTSVVSLELEQRITTYISATQLSISLRPADLVVPGMIDISVINGLPGGGPSNSLSFEIRRAPVTITLSASPGAAVSGEAVTFTATVAPVSSSITYIPGMTVTFMNGATVLGTLPLSLTSPATTSITGNRFSAGTYSITAVYSGDTNFQPRTSTPLNLVVNKANVTVIVSSSPNITALGTQVTFYGNVTAANPGSDTPLPPDNGTLQFLRNGIPMGAPQPVSSGSATYLTSAFELLGGVHQITAQYDGTTDANFNSGSTSVPAPAIHTVTKTTTAVTVNATSSTYGQAALLSVTVSAQNPVFNGNLAPANGGLVTFKDGSTVLGTATLTGSTLACACATASFTTTPFAFTAGSKAITVDFDGSNDPNFGNATGSGSHTVFEASTSITLLTSSNSNTSYGQAVTFTATVGGGLAGTPTTGTINFYSDNIYIGTSGNINSGGVASLTTSNTTLTGGTHAITAYYNGQDPNFLGSPQSYAITQTVNKINVLLVSLTGSFSDYDNIPCSNCNPHPYTSANYTAVIQVPSGLAAATGSVTYKFDSSWGNGDCPNTDDHNVPPSTLSVGQAYYHQLNNDEGLYQVVATYNGDNNYNGFTSVPHYGTVDCP